MLCKQCHEKLNSGMIHKKDDNGKRYKSCPHCSEGKYIFFTRIQAYLVRLLHVLPLKIQRVIRIIASSVEVLLKEWQHTLIKRENGVESCHGDIILSIPSSSQPLL